MDIVFQPPPPVLVPVRGTGRVFPVRRIYCIGRNYADHVREMGNDPKTEPPLFFMKPADSIVLDGRFPYPPATNDVHHELELVVALGEGAQVFGYAVGIDFTRRDLQALAKKGGRPWEAAKAFDHSAPMSALVPVTEAGRITKGRMTLTVNGETRQDADLEQMIWNVDEILAELGRFFALKPGDLIFTGTPAGVGAVKRGDRLHAAIDGVGQLDVEVV